MSEKGWTPGPWKVGKELGATRGEWLISMDIPGHRGNPIAETRPATGNEFANAHLIAAAPELYEALDTLCAVIGLTPLAGNKEAMQEAFDVARAAMAKARGKSFYKNEGEQR